MVGKLCHAIVGSRLAHSGMHSIREIYFSCLTDNHEDASERELANVGDVTELRP